MSKPKIKYGGVIKSVCNKNSVFCKSGSLRYNKENNQNGGKRYISYVQCVKIGNGEKHENTQINPCVVTKIGKYMKPIKDFEVYFPKQPKQHKTKSNTTTTSSIK